MHLPIKLLAPLPTCPNTCPPPAPCLQVRDQAELSHAVHSDNCQLQGDSCDPSVYTTLLPVYTSPTFHPPTLLPLRPSTPLPPQVPPCLLLPHRVLPPLPQHPQHSLYRREVGLKDCTEL